MAESRDSSVTRGERVFKNYTIDAAPNSYRKERVEARESAQMSFGLRNAFDDASQTLSYAKKPSKRESAWKSNFSQAVPGAVTSLDEIQLEFESEIEEERGDFHNKKSSVISQCLESGSKRYTSPEKPSIIPSCREEASLSPITWLADINYYQEPGVESRLHEASQNHFLN